MSAPVYVATVMRRGAELAARRAMPPQVRLVHAALPARPPERCIYCGCRIRRTSVACPCHRDLLQLDPLFTQNETEPIEDFRPEVLLDRLRPIGA